jgi:hypothetical protein
MKKNEAVQHRAAAIMDDLADFEEARRELLPKLRQAIKEGKSPEEIMAMGKALASARLATIAATELDNKVALAAVNSLLDRVIGKAKETKSIEHSMARAKDEDLDAVLLTALNEASSGEEDK